MTHYRKADIDRHSDGGYGAMYPAVNVKVRTYVNSAKVAEALGVGDGKDVERAMELQFESACESFWEDMQEAAEYAFGKAVKAYSAGRSAGWLIVVGLPDVELWDAVALAKWRRFEKGIRADVDYRTAFEQVVEDIQSNEWHKPGSERYNFFERKDGTIVCIADLKAQAAEAGFGPVVRK